MKADRNNNCIVCNSDAIHSLSGYEASHLYRCKNCSHVFDERIPSEEVLDKHYVYGLDEYLSPLTIVRYNELLDKLEVFRKTGNILDIGCNTGLFLETAQKRGWNCHGTERNDKAIEVCEKKGIQMNSEEWLNDPGNTGKFDVITAFELIEHLGNPNPLIAQMGGVLREGGVMYVTTPNFNAINRYLLRTKWSAVITYPDHLSYFSRRTMHRLMTSNGLVKRNVVTTGFSFTTLKVGIEDSKRRVMSAGSDDDKIRSAIDKHKWLDMLKGIINQVLTLFGIGESLKVLYQKPITNK